MAPDALPGGSSLSWLASPSPTPVRELARRLGTRPPTPTPRLGGRKGPRRGPAGTWVVGGGLLPAGRRPHGLCRPGLQEAPQGSQAPEVADKAGLCPFKELWFEESRCPVGTHGWVGPSWVLMLTPNCRPSESFSGTGAGSLQRHPWWWPVAAVGARTEANGDLRTFPLIKAGAGASSHRTHRPLQGKAGLY